DVTEEVPTGWNLTEALCTLEDGITTTGTRSGNGITGITIEAGKFTTCNFTNIKPPVLTVQKDNDASGDGRFNDTETYPGTTPSDFPADITYQVNITNTGSDATIITITDDIHSIAGSNLYLLNGTEIQADETLTGTFTAMFYNANQISVTNTISVEATNAAGSSGLVTDTSTVIFVQNPSINLTKAMSDYVDEDGDGNVSLNDTLTYTFNVTNDGNVNLTSVNVTDPMPGLSDIICGAANLTLGELTTCTATYTVTQADVDAGWINNTATAKGTPPIGDDVNDTDDEAVNIPQDPSINLTKAMSDYVDEDGDGNVSLNDTLNYTFNVTNDGNVNLTSVNVTDPMPGLSDITCVATNLVPGELTTCTATYVVTQADVDAGWINNTATATGTPPIGENVTDTDDEAVNIPQDPSINLTKTMSEYADEDIDGNVSLDDILTYTFNVTNTGNVNLTSVDVTDPMPGLSDITCVATSLVPGELTTCTANYTVTQADVDAGWINNTANATGTPPIGENVTDTDDEAVKIPQDPSINLTKTMTSNADEDGDFNVSLNDTLTYTFNVTNTGNVNLDPVNVTDPMPGLSPISCDATNLTPGESMNCTANYTVTQADVEAGWINNTANVTGTPPEGDDVNDTDDESVNVPQYPSIDVEKYVSFDNGTTWLDADNSTPKLYMIFFNNYLNFSPEFKFVVNNTGNVNLTGINLTDSDFNLSDCTVPDLLAVGASFECFVIDPWTVVLHNDTATATGIPPIGENVTDTDDANYWAPSHVSP
ncbi:MAG: DUF11 domain-containing protein, partial [Methanosarcinaceae archaeon]|nr:DUF11 domain-containing protein [Methanosarcinaceae archaeon]